ncbi:LLM class flavin-dependent oxidoreductase [Sphingomonas sp. HF-S3]|uniref:LLM class flavin-dependent oxidoreductase n=1 Tax=Sphingomonas rustica TaxID=3103142 RepID=A0ABV0B3P3_9SPHN
MSVSTYWRIDPAADPSRSEPGARRGGLFRDVRPATINRYDYYAQIAQAAAQTAFDGLFIAYRPDCDDSRILAAAIARETPRLALIPEFPSSSGSAVYAAKQAVSFRRATHERLGWAIAPSGDDRDLARTEEFLAVARGVHSQHPFSFAGDHFEVQGGGFEAPLNRVRAPQVFLQGDSEESLALSARAADVHLFAAAPIDSLRHAVEALDAASLSAGRTVGFGLIQPILAREDDDEARRDAERLGLGPDALVGTYDAVADRLAQLAALGIGHLVLTAPSSLEEAYRTGQHVLPRLRARTDPARAAA